MDMKLRKFCEGAGRGNTWRLETDRKHVWSTISDLRAATLFVLGRKITFGCISSSNLSFFLLGGNCETEHT